MTCFAGAPHTSSIERRPQVGSRSPLLQAFGDRLGRLQGRLGQCRILDDLALNPRCLPVQHVTHGLQLGDELVDLLH